MTRMLIAAYVISLLLVISPAFNYIALTRYNVIADTFMIQVLSVVPFIAGVILLVVLRIKKP